MIRVLSVVGARPQFVKVAVIKRELNLWTQSNPSDGLRHLLIHTGQHYDYAMSQLFFDGLGLPAPDYYLDVRSGSHGEQTGLMLRRIEENLIRERPDAVITYGDTNSTLAAALAAVKLRLPVAHVEAGLRSYNRGMAEEINRVLTDHVSDLLFCPTQRAVDNLRREGIEDGVHRVGDVMYDSILLHAGTAERYSTVLGRLGLARRDYILATIHRAENTDDPQRLRSIWSALMKAASSGLPVVIPLHPRTANRFPELTLKTDGMLVTEPVSYTDMIVLQKHARLVVTDSGGVQKEAFFLRVPCITVRDETEWPETVESGWNVLAGADEDRILSAIRECLSKDLNEPITSRFGDGHAGAKIVSLLIEHLGIRSRAYTERSETCLNHPNA